MATRRPKVPQAHYGAAPAREEAKAAVEPILAPEQSESQTSEADKNAARQERHANRKPVSQGPSARVGSQSSSNGRTGVADATQEPEPVPARSFSGRLLVLGLVMAVITLLLAPNVHTFMEQRAEIAALKQDIANKQVQQTAFQTELARWDDPAYVKQQARDRVSMLMPGETGYWVYGANGTDEEDSANAAGTSAIKATTVTTQPWVNGLWDAVQKSAEVKVTPAPSASKSGTETKTTPTPSPSSTTKPKTGN